LAGSQENIIFIAAPDVAVKIALRTNNRFAYPVFSTGGLSAGQLVCLAVNCLAVAGDDTPRFEVSDQATVHLDDTTPLAISAAGTVAAPTRSNWQTDTRTVRLILELNYVLRTTNAIAWTESITW
jgi:hypothetical protein